MNLTGGAVRCFGRFATRRRPIRSLVVGASVVVMLVVGTGWGYADTIPPPVLRNCSTYTPAMGSDKYRCAETSYIYQCCFWVDATEGWLISRRAFNSSRGGDDGFGAGFERWWLQHSNVWVYRCPTSGSGCVWEQHAFFGPSAVFTNLTWFPSPMVIPDGGGVPAPGRETNVYYCFMHNTPESRGPMGQIIPAVTQVAQLRHELHNNLETPQVGCPS